MSAIALRRAGREQLRGAPGFLPGMRQRIDRLGVLQVVTDDAPPKPGAIAARLTPEGYLRVEARIARAGLLEYSDGRTKWLEYRPADELFSPASLDSFRLALVTDDHPRDMVSSENARELGIGVVAQDVRREVGDDGIEYLTATIQICDAATIEKVKAGKVQLSIGFVSRITEEAGSVGDMPYRYTQRDIAGNHVALVDRGRAGPQVRLMLDAATFAWCEDGVARTVRMDTEDAMDPEMVEVEIGGQKYQVAQPVAQAMAALQQQVTSMKGGGGAEAEGTQAPPANAAAPATGATPAAAAATPAAGTAPAAAATGTPAVAAAPTPQPQAAATTPPPQPARTEPKDGADELGRVRAQADGYKAQLEQERSSFDTRVDARVDLVLAAREVLGDDVELVREKDGKRVRVGDDELRAAVIAKAMPGSKAKLDEHKAEPGYVRALFDHALAVHRGADGRTSVSDAADRARASSSRDTDSATDSILDAAGKLVDRRQNPNKATAAA